jgi:sugar phosphate isomerase/epimerase
VEEIGIAGWALNRAILRERTLALLDFPAVARQEFGVGTIELVSTFFERQDAAYLNRLREAIERERLRVANIAVDTGTLATPDPATRRTDLEAIKQWVHVARAVGSEAIRVNTGDAAPDDAGALDRVIEGYRELADHAAEAGVKLLIENHGGLSAAPRNLAAILERVDSPAFGACPDVDNFPGDTWEEGLTIMAPRAVVAHVKVAGYDPEGWQRRTGRDGQPQVFNLRRSLAILKAAGYRGPLNFEYNHAESDERAGIAKGIAYLRETLATL